MSSTSKFRMHMGCGEPLQSRSWIAQPMRILLTLGKNERQSMPRTAARRGARGKS